MKIGLLSDTHSYLDDTILQHFKSVDEIWHAGDIGTIDIIDRLNTVAPVYTVYGNIDNHVIRSEFDEYLVMERAGITILMIHIAGRLGSYNAKVRELIAEHKPGVLVAGHSHILKVQYDRRFELLYVNPGACGHHGFHIMRTVLMFDIENGRIQNMSVIELGRRGR